MTAEGRPLRGSKIIDTLPFCVSCSANVRKERVCAAHFGSGARWADGLWLRCHYWRDVRDSRQHRSAHQKRNGGRLTVCPYFGAFVSDDPAIPRYYLLARRKGGQEEVVRLPGVWRLQKHDAGTRGACARGQVD